MKGEKVSVSKNDNNEDEESLLMFLKCYSIADINKLEMIKKVYKMFPGLLKWP